MFQLLFSLLLFPPILFYFMQGELFVNLAWPKDGPFVCFSFSIGAQWIFQHLQAHTHERFKGLSHEGGIPRRKQ